VEEAQVFLYFNGEFSYFSRCDDFCASVPSSTSFLHFKSYLHEWFELHELGISLVALNESNLRWGTLRGTCSFAWRNTEPLSRRSWHTLSRCSSCTRVASRYWQALIVPKLLAIFSISFHFEALFCSKWKLISTLITYVRLFLQPFMQISACFFLCWEASTPLLNLRAQVRNMPTYLLLIPPDQVTFSTSSIIVLLRGVSSCVRAIISRAHADKHDYLI